ncbi:hypothetical protein EX895_001147 [Sporisorium graminicola]|uniref:Uncharacterized protein n=1 Tax=Sporisorium graminicola TaxID=280036 RepID=A0A4U7KZ63_9BASI|nr:hypothetical protein EX895_001147 [Sporisorium graminicola]TKY89850.1 hypothetical protein EX895_001147 [Sporisorium graminicola]
MRSLVFLPPPNLSHFPTAAYPHSIRQTTFTLASHPPLDRPARILADETRAPSHNVSQQQEVIVPDSVDLHQEVLHFDSVQDDESIARSEVPDAPVGVPWEVLHGVDASVAGAGIDRGDARRALKRVRIRSPVLVVETPERRGFAFKAQNPRAGGEGSSDGQEHVYDQEGRTEVEADKSRVVLGEESDSGDEHADTSNSIVRRSIVADETNATLPCLATEHTSNAGVDQSRHDTDQSSHRYDLSLVAAIPVSRVAAAKAANHSTSSTAAPPERVSADTNPASQSASSLQIRPPVPAAVGAGEPQATCRFTFFSKRAAPRASNSITAASATNHALADDEPSTQLQPAPTHACPSTVAAAPTHNDRGESSIRATLPTMNAYEASYDSLPFRAAPSEASLEQQHSILPPPILHFTLAHVTPLSRILAQPMHYISSSTPRAARFGADGAAALGGVSSRVNLLVVVKEVGEVKRVRNRFAVDAPNTAARSARGDVGRGVSRAFEEAAREQNASDSRDGKTERLELVVMDGRMSPIRRLIDHDSMEEWSLVEEPEEKSLFTVVLWGAIARDWSNPALSLPDLGLDLDPTTTPATTLTPTPLQPGDVISLTNLALSPRPPLLPSLPPSDAKRRLGTGLAAKISLAAHASARNKSAVELCYRSHTLHPHTDAPRNFDDAVAAFDLRSRRVLELCRLWKCQRF